MNRKHNERTRHLKPEELEMLAISRPRRLPARSSAHAAECERCRRAAGELKALHAALRALAPLRPMAGFSDRVMRRVRLPLPWRVRVLQALRQHQLAAASGFAGAAAAVGVGLMWIARYPELTPVTIAAFLVQRSVAAMWAAVMAIGRFVYGSGILDLIGGVAGQVTLVSAFVAVATVTLVGLGALRILLTLMDTNPASAQVEGR